MEEEWRDVPELSPYQVSNLGRVRRSDYGRIINGWLSFGYRVVNICIDGKPRKYLVHVLVALAFLGERPTEPNGQQYDINHKDGDRDNNALINLEYITKLENIQHSFEIHPYWTRNFQKYISPRTRERMMEWDRIHKEGRKNGK